MTTCSQCGQKFPGTVRLCPNDGTVLEHAAATATQAGTVLDGKYRLDALLAEGGMGAVYSATHVMLGKKIAIKLIRAELGTSPEIVRRFQREARAATALNHPNIVSVYDLGQTPNGTLYIAMEFIDGPSLRTLIQAGRAMAPVRTISILKQVASALATAHKHNIIHRDLKPHNIMLATGPDGNEQAKLVDFGIAKTFDEATQLTSLGSALGTPYYMSPEQIEGGTVDARSDIYALGIILYEMLVGEVPFSDQSTPAVLVKQLKERPQRPSLKNPAVPPALEEIALRCLEKDPDQRFQTADEFAAALNDASATLHDDAAMAALSMATLPMTRPPAGTQPASDATAVSPARAATPAAVVAPRPQSAPPARTTPAAAAMPAASASVAPAPPPPAPGTKPTLQVPQMPQPGASSSDAAPRKSSSILPLMAAAILLFALAGGYLLWSQRQVSAPQSAQADAPKATPAMAPQEPASAPSSASSSSSTPSSSGPATTLPPPPTSATVTPTPGSSPAANTPAAGGGSNEAAATAVATKEALAAKMPPTTAAASAVKGATQQATNARAASPAVSAPAPPRTAAPAAGRQPAAQPAAAPEPVATIPENAAVLFRCSGAPDVCASLRTNVNEALDKAGYHVVNSPDRADIAIGAVAGGLQEKVTQQFGQTFATRTYQIELSGEAPKLGDMVAMPPATTVSFDAAVGRERLEEKSRLVAGDIVERVRAFVKKKHGGNN